ncbi:MAG: 30S ribosomal protein S19e [archaeon]|nr:30S ribosomal protein S19e [archaeon]
MGIFDVPASELIKEAAGNLKQKIQKPGWIEFAKTGESRERAPQDRDFWFVRNASILYRVYKEGPLGTGSLRTYYGGRKNRGVRPEHHRKGSGKIIRLCLQTLEKEGFIKKTKKGRAVTPFGEKFLLAVSRTVEKRLDEQSKQKKELQAEMIAKAKQAAAEKTQAQAQPKHEKAHEGHKQDKPASQHAQEKPAHGEEKTQQAPKQEKAPEPGHEKAEKKERTVEKK